MGWHRQAALPGQHPKLVIDSSRPGGLVGAGRSHIACSPGFPTPGIGMDSGLPLRWTIRPSGSGMSSPVVRSSSTRQGSRTRVVVSGRAANGEGSAHYSPYGPGKSASVLARLIPELCRQAPIRQGPAFVRASELVPFRQSLGIVFERCSEQREYPAMGRRDQASLIVHCGDGYELSMRKLLASVDPTADEHGRSTRPPAVSLFQLFGI
jgi:hypothetical protein